MTMIDLAHLSPTGEHIHCGRCGWTVNVLLAPEGTLHCGNCRREVTAADLIPKAGIRKPS